MTNIEAMTAEMRGRDLEEDPSEITQVRKRRRTLGSREIPAGVEIYEVNGLFLFGAADKVKDGMLEISKPPKVLILRMRNVPAIDATGIHARDRWRRSAARRERA